MHLAAELSDREQRLERTTRECKAHKNTLEDMERSRKLERQAQSSAHTAEKNELKEQTLERTHQMQQQHTEALSKHQRESKLRVRVVTTLVGTRFRQTEFRVVIVAVALLWRAIPSSCTLSMCTPIQFLMLSAFIPRLKKLSYFFFTMKSSTKSYPAVLRNCKPSSKWRRKRRLSHNLKRNNSTLKCRRRAR